MTHELKLPALGENIESAIVGAVLVSAGDSIEKDQPVVEVETDKATAEVPSTLRGIVKEVRVKKGARDDLGRPTRTARETGRKFAETVRC